MNIDSNFNVVRQIFTEYLEKKGYRKTQERYAILDEIYSQPSHFDIEALYFSMKEKKYRVSRATLYNTINILIDANLVIKHQIGNSPAQYERAYQCSQHDHLIDVDTGKVFEFCDPRINDIIRTACEINGFEPLYHSLYIYGREAEKNSFGKQSKQKD